MTVDLYHCLRCRAKRWWKADHHRGDIALGEVTKNYEVRKCGDGQGCSLAFGVSLILWAAIFGAVGHWAGMW